MRDMQQIKQAYPERWAAVLKTLHERMQRRMQRNPDVEAAWERSI